MIDLNKLQTDYRNIPDLTIKNFVYNRKELVLMYLETLCSSDKINNYILKILNTTNKFRFNKSLPIAQLISINASEFNYYLFNGFSIIIYNNKTYALETKADLSRSISTPEIEPGLYGPKDALTENFHSNIGLIKRRIKNSHLKLKENTIGRYTNTRTGIMYIDNIAKQDLVNKIDNEIKKINTDSIIDSSELIQYLTNKKQLLFPTAKLTERPDTIVKALLNGKIVIFVDNSPFALIIPAFLSDFVNPVSDEYYKSTNINFIKILRSFCFIITIIIPAYYIAITNFNHETIPTKLIISISAQRLGVPFPAIIEVFVLLLVYEILRESDIRFPNNFGKSISILGALILGDAAVSAGIVSPIMIIIVAITFISSLIFNDVEVTNAIRIWRYIYLIVASFLGLYGITLCSLFLIVSLSSYKTFNKPYMFPIAPFNLAYIKATLFKVNRQNDFKRSEYLTDNITKQRIKK